MKTKISFDFDDTLDNKLLQKYVIQLQKLLIYDIWIHTSRMNDEYANQIGWNNDLYLVANKVGIPKEKIIFTNSNDKWVFLKDESFYFHLDDDMEEIKLINENTDCLGIFFSNKMKKFLWKNGYIPFYLK